MQIYIYIYIYIFTSILSKSIYPNFILIPFLLVAFWAFSRPTSKVVISKLKKKKKDQWVALLVGTRFVCICHMAVSHKSRAQRACDPFLFFEFFCTVFIISLFIYLFIIIIIDIIIFNNTIYLYYHTKFTNYWYEN